MRTYLWLFCFTFLLAPLFTLADIPETLLLTPSQQRYLAELIRTNPSAKTQWLKVEEEAKGYLNDAPRPLRVIHYEGLLDTDTRRIDTEKSLRDMDKLAAWLFAYYGPQDKLYAQKAKTYILAWAGTYEPTGNPINENKLEPLIHCYQTMKSYFSESEQKKVGYWLAQIAEAEISFPNMPENNWKTKQIKLVGTIGLILNREPYVVYAIEQSKGYIDKALYGDGTSRDLRQRDALSYHVSGLKPLMTLAITMDQLSENKYGLQTFNYQNPAGGSLRKSVDYVVPYALGEKTHAEWVNTKVELDRQRAAAGIAHYQPGTLYEPERSREMFELASYFAPSYQEVLRNLKNDGRNEFNSWFSVLVAAARE
ncbi:alginate lyase family protein [Salmonirosea aquatica]|uniref:Alginate lyase domain-containing protein n=1 Tax=Salmonirosea aquatica TaxID=2654236 RepID=A0A7C9FP19_9BACT|nr:hypothetical protein [Cytophagaceae bacterium SJW1-29]